MRIKVMLLFMGLLAIGCDGCEEKNCIQKNCIIEMSECSAGCRDLMNCLLKCDDDTEREACVAICGLSHSQRDVETFRDLMVCFENECYDDASNTESKSADKSKTMLGFDGITIY